jgi:hypothetical protein
MIVHPHAQQHVAPPFPQPQYQPPWQPPRRKSWARRHKFLTSLGALAAAIIVIVIAAAASSSGGKPDTAALAACTSHRAISSRQWLQVVKDPGAAKGECLTVYGEVSQFDSVTGDSVFRAQAGGVKATPSFGFVNYPTNALFDGDAKMLGVLVENDLFTAQVTVAGSQSYDTTLGGQTTVPVFRVDSVTRTGHLGS